MMGLGGPTGLYAVGRKLQDVALKTVEAMMMEDASVISLYYGSEVEEAEAQKLADALAKKYKGLDVELYQGGQPIYYYILSVE